MQGVFDRSTIEQTGINWVGEDGVLVAASSIALAMIFAPRRRPTLLAPRTPLTAPERV